jgi:hypothetical protein
MTADKGKNTEDFHRVHKGGSFNERGGGPWVLPKRGARDTPWSHPSTPLLLLLLHLSDLGAALLAGAVGALAVSARALPLLLTRAT